MRWHIQSLETQLGKDLVVACANKVRPINTLVIHLIILQFQFSDWLHHILSVVNFDNVLEFLLSATFRKILFLLF